MQPSVVGFECSAAIGVERVRFFCSTIRGEREGRFGVPIVPAAPINSVLDQQRAERCAVIRWVGEVRYTISVV